MTFEEEISEYLMGKAISQPDRVAAATVFLVSAAVPLWQIKMVPVPKAGEFAIQMGQK